MGRATNKSTKGRPWKRPKVAGRTGARGKPTDATRHWVPGGRARAAAYEGACGRRPSRPPRRASRQRNGPPTGTSLPGARPAAASGAGPGSRQGPGKGWWRESARAAGRGRGGGRSRRHRNCWRPLPPSRRRHRTARPIVRLVAPPTASCKPPSAARARSQLPAGGITGGYERHGGKPPYPRRRGRRHRTGATRPDAGTRRAAQQLHRR